MNIRDIKPHDRPREKLILKGATTLTDLELLQALIGSGNKQSNVSTIAKQAQLLLEKRGINVEYDQFREITGLGPARSTQLVAALEIGRRFFTIAEQPLIDTPEKVVELLDDIRNKKQEYFMCLTLNGANRLITKRIITIGTLTSSLVHPREVFSDAITDRAASIIVAHNHPSGSLEPSHADQDVTARLQKVGNLIGITLLDHIIVTSKAWTKIV